MTEPRLSVRARFERFPATLKGAFIIRGEDPNPHQVVLGPAAIVPVAGGQRRRVPIAESTLDIAPKQDVFVPFETGVGELEPGWYELECELEVDGIRRAYPGGRRFSVAWPRASTRRGTVPIRKEVRLDEVRVTVAHLECAADRVTLVARSRPPTELDLALEVDGRTLPPLDLAHGEDGLSTLTAYPLLKTQGEVRVRVAAGASSGTLDVRLP